jgi:hypothetical protein
LFDIDGTLITSGGAGEKALCDAMSSRFGVVEDLKGIVLAGATDAKIAIALLEKHNLAPSPSNITALLDEYLGHLESRIPRHNGRVLPGMIELLDALSIREEAVLALLTGNVARGARKFWKRPCCRAGIHGSPPGIGIKFGGIELRRFTRVIRDRDLRVTHDPLANPMGLPRVLAGVNTLVIPNSAELRIGSPVDEHAEACFAPPRHARVAVGLGFGGVQRDQRREQQGGEECEGGFISVHEWLNGRHLGMVLPARCISLVG